MAGDWGVRRINPPTIKFQSTPAHGGRRDLGEGELAAHDVSIHARAWRATRHLGAGQLVAPYVSIHARAWRATTLGGDGILLNKLFQSTPALGGRRFRMAAAMRYSACFNPRPRMAGDLCHVAGQGNVQWFQSTPAHGGRHSGGQRFTGRPPVSIHARAWRATVEQAVLFAHTEPFQSTPAHGGRL
jgi:hypothetical protein